jgi:2'-5' RNA ligase
MNLAVFAANGGFSQLADSLTTSMRTFIAIELSREIQEYLARLQDKLKLSQADVKWVAPENIHLTLKFLGEIDEKIAERIKQILQNITAGLKQFSLNLTSVGAFPSLNSPRAIWIGIDKGDAQVREIADVLEEKLSELGITKEDRTFSSHITLGRTRSSKNRSNLAKLLESLKEKLPEATAEIKVEKITLFKSTLTPKGPIYEILKEAPLENPKSQILNPK